jgi:ubiquinol-cytochrome c reductase cytochrome c1 subunit
MASIWGRALRRSIIVLGVVGVLPALTLVSPASAQPATPGGTPGAKPGAAASEVSEHSEIRRQKWTFGGLFGYFDQQQLRRGYKVYKDVCANCHNMRLLSYRNLGQPGGPQFPKEEVEALAAEVQVADGYNDQGEVAMRPGKPSDPFQWRFKNEKEAAAALGGAVPPDLSLMAKARSYERNFAWYAFPWVMLKDLATQYQEQGADYIYALLTGYSDPPAGKQMADGLYYNKAFPGNQLAMPQPLTDGAVEYADKTPNTLDQETRDVTAFLAWAAEPHLVERKKLGLWVLIYLGVLSVLLFISKRTMWRNVEH